MYIVSYIYVLDIILYNIYTYTYIMMIRTYIILLNIYYNIHYIIVDI